MKAFCASAVLALCACDMVEVYQGQIDTASRAIEKAKTDAERAAAHADRGRGYSDKGRLSFVRKAIDRGEYLRLFSQAIEDHDKAVALDPLNAEMYFKRGLSYYDRAAQVGDLDSDHAPWFDAARNDFTKAAGIDPRHMLAWDYLGMVDEQSNLFDEAVTDYTRVKDLDPKRGASRLAELYCNRGQGYLGEKRLDLAAADLEKSVELGASSDGCSCEPYNSLAYIYEEERQLDKGWELVRRARAAGQSIAPEYVERLKQASGRNG
jgi:tetratricopeptide (TPR) repeat protein